MAGSDRLTFLVDSNVFFTLEPYGMPAVSEPYDLAARFHRLLHEHGHLLAIHAGTREDIQNDRDLNRRAHRLRALEKYRVIEGLAVSERLGDPLSIGSDNDAVDAAIASALEANAAHYFVTEDKPLQTRLRRIAPDLGERVLSLAQAVELLDAMHPEAKAPPPLVQLAPCYQIALSDPIFDSIRDDYPGFDDWFTDKCQRAHRGAFVIRGEDESIAGLCILKDEDDDEYGLPRRRLKLCTVKVAESYRGQRLGELLVKAALDNAIERDRSGLSVTVLDKHTELLGLLADLGFENVGERTDLDEVVLFRSLKPSPKALAELSAFEFNRRYGPRLLNTSVPIHVVPIQPQWEERLFPEGKLQLDLLHTYAACGNGLRKAYLSRSFNRQVQVGDILLFYRSSDLQAVRFVAVVEDILVSPDHLEIARFVGTRTVYSVKEIADLTQNGAREVNAILMRQSRQLEPSWALQELRGHGVFLRPPQSIQSAREEGAEWVRNQLAA
jgi:ribosomal protein S18 acetylase RimI-like enzyme